MLAREHPPACLNPVSTVRDEQSRGDRTAVALRQKPGHTIMPPAPEHRLDYNGGDRAAVTFRAASRCQTVDVVAQHH